MIKKVWLVLLESPDIKVKIASSRPLYQKAGSNLIMWFQKTNYSHVLVIVNDMVFQASHGFANNVPIDHFLKDNIIVDVVEIKKEECDFEFLFNALGKRYGYVQLFKIAYKYLMITKLKITKSFRHKDNGVQSLICSEYVGKFLKLDWVNDLTDPRQIIEHLMKIKK